MINLDKDMDPIQYEKLLIAETEEQIRDFLFTTILAILLVLLIFSMALCLFTL